MYVRASTLLTFHARRCYPFKSSDYTRLSVISFRVRSIKEYGKTQGLESILRDYNNVEFQATLALTVHQDISGRLHSL